VAHRSSNKTMDSAKYHLTWRPKDRQLVWAGPVEAGLEVIIGSGVAEFGGEVEGMPDHVHLLVEVPPAIALSGLVERLAGHSSGLMRQEFPHRRRLGTLEGPSLSISTADGAPHAVRGDVENQKDAA
jgi:putative transposase